MEKGRVSPPHPPTFRAQGTSLGHFLVLGLEENQRKSPAAIADTTSSICLPALCHPHLFPTFPPPYPSASLEQFSGKFFLFAVVHLHSCPDPQSSVSSRVSKLFPIFLTPVFSRTSVNNLFSPSHFFLSNSFLLSCWGRFKNEDPAAAYLEVQAATRLKCLNFRLKIFLQAWPNLSCPANDVSLLLHPVRKCSFEAAAPIPHGE